MPSDQSATPEDTRMITFIAIAPDGTAQRLEFATEAEAQEAADQHRQTGHSIYWRAWSETLRCRVSIPED